MAAILYPSNLQIVVVIFLCVFLVGICALAIKGWLDSIKWKDGQ